MTEALDELGVLTLAGRMRRVTEKLSMQVDTVYQESGVDFQAAWFPILFLLADRDAMSVTELAESAGQTHSAISQMAKKLIDRGLIERFSDGDDRRRSDLVLTESGADLIVSLQPVWTRMVDALSSITNKSKHNLLTALGDFESAIDNESLSSRLGD